MSRELDAKIARGLGTNFAVAYRSEGEAIMGCPLYSTDGNAMLTLIAEMRGRGWYIATEFDITCGKYYSAFWHKDGGVMAYANADTLPEAVTLAAYKALKGEDWQDA